MALRQIRQRIDCALQDMRRGKGIDFLRTLGPADVRFDHRTLDRLGRPALVPEEDRKVQRSKVAGESADRLSARGVASVHVEGQSQDKARNLFPLNEFPKRFEVGGELGPSDRFGWPGEAPAQIADRQPDGLGPDVEPGELAV